MNELSINTSNSSIIRILMIATRKNNTNWIATNHILTLAESLGFEDSGLPSVSVEEIFSSSSFDLSS